MSLASSLGTILCCTSIANLTLLAGGALLDFFEVLGVPGREVLSGRFCVGELTRFESLEANRLISLFADSWLWSSLLDDDDDATDDDATDDDDDKSLARLLPTDAWFVFAPFAHE